MTACDECGSTRGHGHFETDGKTLCRRCYNQTKTQMRTCRTDNPHAEQRSRHRVINNEVAADE